MKDQAAACETFTDVAAFLAAKGFRCELLAATITPEQCQANRNRGEWEAYPCPRCTQVKPAVAAAPKKRGKKKATPWQLANDEQRQRNGKEKPMDTFRHGATLCDADLIEPRETPMPAPTVKADKKEEKTMARKKCSERGCDKGFIKDGLCWAHYTAKHGEQPFDHKKRPACAVEGCTRLSNKGEFCTRHAKNQQAPIAPVPVKSPRQAGTVATIPPPAAAVPETPAASSKRPAKQEEPPQDLVPVAFDGRDAELLVSLQEAADYNRRTLVAEILYRLDRSFDGQRFICVS